MSELGSAASMASWMVR